MYSRRSWTKMYWDIVDQLYWAPQYIGMKSIPRKYWETSGERVSVPRSMTNPKGPLYRRFRSSKEFWPYIQRQEETFNHIFELVFSIMPGDAIADIFGCFVNTGELRDFEAHGREFSTRIGYGWLDNITTPDGFYTSSDSILAVELKFNAKTSLDQLAKYAMVITAEQRVSGKRRNQNLLYVFPTAPETSFREQTGLNHIDVDQDTLSVLESSPQNKTVRAFFAEHREEIGQCLRHLKISCISWTDFLSSLQAYSSCLGTTVGDRTLKRLVDGLIDEILVHPLSNAVG